MIDGLLNPVVGLSVLLALIYTLAVHLFMGLGFRGVIWHWLLAIVGMAAGYGIALRAHSQLPTLGDLHLIESSLAAIALLVLAGFKVKLSPPTQAPSSPNAG